jgi:hypothetical protein
MKWLTACRSVIKPGVTAQATTTHPHKFRFTSATLSTNEMRPLMRLKSKEFNCQDISRKDGPLGYRYSATHRGMTRRP